MDDAGQKFRFRRLLTFVTAVDGHPITEEPMDPGFSTTVLGNIADSTESCNRMQVSPTLNLRPTEVAHMNVANDRVSMKNNFMIGFLINLIFEFLFPYLEYVRNSYFCSESGCVIYERMPIKTKECPDFTASEVEIGTVSRSLRTPSQL